MRIDWEKTVVKTEIVELNYKKGLEKLEYFYQQIFSKQI